ncbi:MAG: SPOR domain-containing protein [Cuspidothrix sp.]
MSHPHSSSTPELNPTLSTALASLEVQLEQELTRYRRTRKNFPQPPSVTTETYIRTAKNPNLNDIQLPVVAVTETQGLSLPQELTTPEPQENTISENVAISSSSIVQTKIQTSNNQTLVATNDTPQVPNDYLESSEALLRSLTAGEESEKTPVHTSREAVLSPVGIASISCLLLATLTLSYVIFNPKNLPQLNSSNLVNGNSSPTGENTDIENNSQTPIIEAKITPIPKYPNLASQEFRQVRDPQDIVDLTPKVKPTPLTIQPSLNPIASSQVVPPVPTLVSTPLPKLTPTPSPVAENVKPSPSPLAIPENVKPSADGYYYIIADNESEQVFATARRVIGDAYFSPNRKFIYLGALKTKDDVKQRLEQLEAKGIKARVQAP